MTFGFSFYPDNGAAGFNRTAVASGGRAPYRELPMGQLQDDLEEGDLEEGLPVASLLTGNIPHVSALGVRSVPGGGLPIGTPVLVAEVLQMEEGQVCSLAHCLESLNTIEGRCRLGLAVLACTGCLFPFLLYFTDSLKRS